MAVVVGIGRRGGVRHQHDRNEGGDAHVERGDGGDDACVSLLVIHALARGGTFEIGDEINSRQVSIKMTKHSGIIDLAERYKNETIDHRLAVLPTLLSTGV